MVSSDSDQEFSFEKELAEYKEGKDLISKTVSPINCSKCLLQVVTLEKNRLIIDWSI